MSTLEGRLRTALVVGAEKFEVSPDAWQQHQRLLRESVSPQRKPRHWLWAAAAVVCAVAVAVAVVVGIRTTRGSAPPADHPTPPAPTGSPSAEQQFSAKYLSRCVSADRYDPPATKRGIVVRLVRKDAFGLIAVIAKTEGFVVCAVEPDGKIGASSFITWIGGGSTYLRYPVNHEYNTHPHPQQEVVPPAENYNLDVGRVASNVARVEYRQAGHTSLATLGNGFYLVRAPSRGGVDGIRGYDVSGNLIYDDSLPLHIEHIPWP